MPSNGINSPSLDLNPTIGDWLSFTQPDYIGIKSGKVEFGQGIGTALRQIVASELDVEVESIHYETVNTDHSPNEAFTAGSMSIEHSGNALRAAARAVRILIASPESDPTHFTEIDMAINIRSVLDDENQGFGLTRNHATNRSPRIDLPDKIRGKSAFLQDWRLPNQLFARMIHPPQRGCELSAHSPEAALAISGVLHVFCDKSFLAVIARNEYSAIKGAEIVLESASWSIPNSGIDSDTIFERLRKTTGVTEVYAEAGDDPADDSRAGTEQVLEATYSRGFIAHASIGTSCAIALSEGDQLTVWSHTQGIYPLQADLARLLEHRRENVEVIHVPAAGCYGHNPADDVAAEAAILARAFPGTPIALTWSRESELAWDPFGPAAIADISARVAPTGEITSWDYQAFSTGHSTRPTTLPVPAFWATELLNPGVVLSPAGDPPFITGGGIGRNAIPAYRIGRVNARALRCDQMPVRTSALRSLGAHLNVFAIESHMDDLAHLVYTDPIDFRIANLDDQRGIDILNRVREMSNWDSYIPSESTGLGVGYARYKNKGAWSACVAEIEVGNSVVVRNLWIAVDVGQVINLDGVRNQIEGGAIQSLSWALMERVRIRQGKVITDNWEDYPIIRFTEVPPIHLEILDRPEEQSLGSGETVMGPTTAAVGNAVAGVLGIRIRELPLDSENILKAIS